VPDALKPVAGRVVPIAATHIYQMSFFTGFGVSAVVYCLLSYLFPPRGSRLLGRHFEELDVSEPSEETEDDEKSEKSYGKADMSKIFMHDA
jgi:nucleobase:cation symporter-1, NCS1 family